MQSRSARITTRAPTRIDFGGGWTDVPPYPERDGGFVCNLAIARRATVTLRPSSGDTRIDDQGATWRGSDLRGEGPAALARAALRRAGAAAVELTLRSDFPAGAGLGGSSAAGVALAAALAALRGDAPSRVELAERSRSAEVEELGIPGGRQDHYTAAFGGALALGFGAHVDVARIGLDATCRAALERRCVVAYTGQSRISGATITAVIDAYRSGEPRVARALAAMKALAMQTADALRGGDIDALGALVGEHWTHQRSLHPLITTERIEHLMDIGRGAGAIGGKALGASGGGCVLLVAADGREEQLRSALRGNAELLSFTVDELGVEVVATGSEEAAEARDHPAF